MLTQLKTTTQSDTVRSTVETITPTVAKHLRDSAHFERQRKISPVNVARLSKEMHEGRFTQGTQIYICVLPNGHQLIVNGNHTLEAIAESGVPQVLTITRKRVADEEDAGRIYAVFDIQKVRTWRDSLRATGAGDDIPNADLVLTAIGIIQSRFAHINKPSPSRIDRINKMQEYAEAAELWTAATAGGARHNFKLIKRAAVMAVALETLRYQPSFAYEFWQRVANDDGLTSVMPEKALLGWLRNTRGAGGQPAQREHARATALAWNAAFRNEQRQVIKPNAMSSFFLLGTPWAKGFGG